jgi:hypothetical protein
MVAEFAPFAVCVRERSLVRFQVWACFRASVPAWLSGTAFPSYHFCPFSSSTHRMESIAGLRTEIRHPQSENPRMAGHAPSIPCPPFAPLTTPSTVGRRRFGSIDRSIDRSVGGAAARGCAPHGWGSVTDLPLAPREMAGHFKCGGRSLEATALCTYHYSFVERGFA